MTTPTIAKATLEIDQRELQLIDELGKMEVPFEVRNMDAGDARILHGETVVCVIERKTLADLDQSIKDGRYRDQKKRMLDTYPRSSVIYIIEGSAFSASASASGSQGFGFGRFQPDHDRTRGAILNSMLRDDLKVYCVENARDTAVFLREALKRVAADPGKYTGTGGGIERVSTTTIPCHKRNSQMTPETFAEQALTLVPGVSSAIAARVVEAYGGSLKDIIANGDAGTIGDIKTASGRRVGGKVAGRILEYIKK